MERDSVDFRVTWSRVFEAWRGTTHPPFEAAIVVVEMLLWLDVVARREPLENDGKTNGELTAGGWGRIIQELEQDLSLPAGLSLGAHADTITRRTPPGLFESTRRLLEPVHAVLRRPENQNAVLEFWEAGQSQLGAWLGRGGGGGETSFMDPPELTLLLAELLQAQGRGPVYCPFDGSSSVAVQLAARRREVFAEVRYEELALLLVLIARLGHWPLEVRVTDPIRQPAWVDGQHLRRFAAAAAIAPMSRKYDDAILNDPYQRFPERSFYGEVVHIAHLLARSQEYALAVVPEGFLFRTAGGERDFKEGLLRRGQLRAVVRLPRGFFAAAPALLTSLLVFDPPGTSSWMSWSESDVDVLFVDASADTFDLGSKPGRQPLTDARRRAVRALVECIRERQTGPHAVLVPRAAIAANDYNLSVDRYVLSEQERATRRLLEQAEAVELEAVAELYRPQVLPQGDEDTARSFYEVALSDLQPSGLVQAPTKAVAVGEKGSARAAKQTLLPGDILVCIKGRVGAVGLVPAADPDLGETGPQDWLAGQTFLIVRLRKGARITSPVVLFRYLSSPVGQGLLQSMATAGAVPTIQMADMRRLPVLVPPPEEQARVLAEHETALGLHQEIQKLQERIARLNREAWPMGQEVPG